MQRTLNAKTKSRLRHKPCPFLRGKIYEPLSMKALNRTCPDVLVFSSQDRPLDHGEDGFSEEGHL
jgi:hypothetical protein